MLLPLAEAAVEHADKTPFYIAAGLLAAWAVVLSFIGIKLPNFPGNAVGARVVMAVSVLLALGAMSGAVLSS